MAEVINSIDLEKDELNRSLGGGLPSNSLILIEGKDGAGKSILVQRLAFGLLEHHKTVTYISTELNTRGFLDQMKSLSYDIKYYLLDGQLMFVPMFPFLGNTELSENFLERLFDTKKIFDNEIIIFDTISFLLIRDSISQEKSFQVINRLKKLNNMNKTIIFCVDPDHLNEKFLTLLRSVADIYFNVEIRTFAGNILRVINVKRFKRPVDYVMDTIPFKVEPGNGLAIEIASFS